MGRVEHLCISHRKGIRKHAVERTVFQPNYGIEGDAHAGPGHRQVSILADDDIETIRQKGLPDLPPGAFAENVVVSGIDLTAVGLGTRIRLGKDVVLSVTQIGKECHSRCHIYHQTGDCIMPRHGLFLRVETGGEVNIGDAVNFEQIVPRERYQAVVLTISDRCSRGETIDTAGPKTAERLEAGIGAHIYRIEIIPDERDRIANRLKHYADGHSIDLILTVGGTGFAPRDVTPEATRDVVERFTPGLDEAMRAASARKTTQGWLSRGVSGIRRSTLIINLPGSERAAVENLEVILDALDHGLRKLRGDPSDCGRPAPARITDTPVIDHARAC